MEQFTEEPEALSFTYGAVLVLDMSWGMPGDTLFANRLMQRFSYQWKRGFVMHAATGDKTNANLLLLQLLNERAGEVMRINRSDGMDWQQSIVAAMKGHTGDAFKEFGALVGLSGPDAHLMMRLLGVHVSIFPHGDDGKGGLEGKDTSVVLGAWEHGRQLQDVVRDM